MSNPQIGNLDACIQDVFDAAMDQDSGPSDPLQYTTLLTRLAAVRPRIPAIYRDAAFEPYVAQLERLREAAFNDILHSDPLHEAEAGLMLDIGQALLQQGEGFEPRALPAFQEVVADLYDGFLGAESRSGVLPSDRETLAPLIKLGNPAFGPYTFPVDATQSLGLGVAVVNVPPANAQRGLLAWTALPHETAGHDILHADDGLMLETGTAVRNALLAEPRAHR